MGFSELVFIALALTAPILLANILARREREAEVVIFHTASLLLNLAVAVTGLMLALLPAERWDQLGETAGVELADPGSFGLIVMAAALWGALISLSPVRRGVARIIPLNPASPVHTLALVLSGYLLAQGALALAPGGLDELAERSTPVTAAFLAVSEGVFALVAIIGIGYPVRRNGRAILERLGLARPTVSDLIIAGVVTAGIVMAWFVFASIWALTSPSQVEQLDRVNTALLSNMDTIWEWLLLAVAAGLGEEILFRGALQPAFGLVPTSILFAALHIQFGYTPAFFFIFLLAIVLGLVRQKTNTTVAILAHIGYDFAQGLLVLLAQYLEQFV